MRALLLGLPCLLCACEPALPEGWLTRDASFAVTDGGADAGYRYVTFTPDGGGFQVVVDAMYSDRWTAVDLDGPLEVPFGEDRWDLAFQRFHIRARGGASGDGGVQIAVVYDAGYEAVSRAPAGPWLEDQTDGPDENADLDTVFNKGETWFAYESMLHTLTPRPLVYVVKTDAAGYFKLKIDGYYDRSGTPSMIRLRFAKVAPP